MDNDDVLVGRVLSRREVLTLLGASGLALLVGCAAEETGQTAVTPDATTQAIATSFPGCVVRPALTEGPYFVDEKLDRSDIRSDPTDGSVKDGAQLDLTINVSQVSSAACSLLAGAMVDIWHCDAAGVYSDATDPGFNTVGQKFLRGFQTTNEQGQVKFTTIYPGWYDGRAVHIHFKIRGSLASGESYEFTSQLFFDDTFTDEVYKAEPYASKGERTLRNDEDGIYNGGGSQLILNTVKTDTGYSAVFDIGLQL